MSGYLAVPKVAGSDEWLLGSYRSEAEAVVVGGCGRSGTTLVRVMLDSHPELFCGPESGLLAAGSRELNLDRIVSRLVQRFDLAASTITATLANSTSHAEFADRILTYAATNAGKPRWAEKTPRNVHHIDWIFEHFPRATFVHVIRDGRDVACSLRTHPRNRVVNGQLIPANTRRPVRECIDRWVADVSAGLAHRGRPGYVEVRYEELVQEPQRVVAELLRALRLAWNPVVLRFHTVTGPTRDVTKFPQNPEAVRPMSNAAVGRWRHDLDTEEMQVVEERAGALLRQLGYSE